MSDLRFLPERHTEFVLTADWATLALLALALAVGFVAGWLVGRRARRR